MSFLLSLLTVCLLSSADVSASVSADNQSSYQTAFLYFLPDYEPKEVDKAEARGCNKLGYTYTRSNCAAPHILKDKCPVGNVYKTCFCAGSTTCTGSTSSSNPYPSSTGADKAFCVNCAGSTLYTWTCSRTCGADITSKPSNSSYTTCTDCSGTHNVGWSCNYGYHKSGNSCEEDCIPLNNETECSYGSENCSDGCGGLRSCCKPDPCASISCPNAKSCTYGCASYSTATSCCLRVCLECKSAPRDPCANVTCPEEVKCSYPYKCSKWSGASCCSHVCTSCSSPCYVYCNPDFYEHIEPCPFLPSKTYGSLMCYNGDTPPYP